MDKSIRNELLSTLADVNEMISSLELCKITGREKAAETTPQLLNAYSLKVRILEQLNNI